MGKLDTVRLGWPGTALVLALAATTASAQVRADWRHVGTAAVDLGLAGLATGPVDRVWYASGALRIRTAPGSFFETADFDSWKPLAAETAAPGIFSPQVPALPEERAQVRVAPSDLLRVYAFGRFVYRSEDGGKHWENISGYKNSSLIGDGLRDLAVSPINPDELTVAGGAGVFRSVDGGRSWHGLNDTLPNLPGPKLLSVPTGAMQIEFSTGVVAEWLSGERRAWSAVRNDGAVLDSARRVYFSEAFNTTVTAVAIQGRYVYVGDANGRILVSSDGMQTWLQSTDSRRGRVNAFWVDANDGSLALAVVGAKTQTPLTQPQTVLHTINAGRGWDVVSAGLPNTSVNGIAVDRPSSAVYVATDAGVFFTRMSLTTLGAAPTWTAVTGLPAGRVSDVRLDEGRTQLWTAVEGPGLYRTLAPHRIGDPLVVSAADLVARAAAPGALLSVTGAKIEAATAGGMDVPVLTATETESQIQVPFNAAGTNLSLAIRGPQGARELSPIPLQAVSPAIFEVDGSPLVLDADRGMEISGMNPARPRMRLQIMASGLGRVRPDWPAGTRTPLENTPQVVAPVTAYWDREQVEVLRAELAPGLTGVYVVEIEVPVFLQYGMAELFINVNGQASNRVHVFSEP